MLKVEIVFVCHANFKSIKTANASALPISLYTEKDVCPKKEWPWAFF